MSKAVVDSEEFTWAIIFVIGCTENPFIKVPIVRNTVLAAQAVIGIADEERRLVNFNGSVANGVLAQYKLYMLCGPQFFSHVSSMTELVNAFYNYLRSTLLEHGIDRDTAYAMCTSVFPKHTEKDTAVRPVLTQYEVKFITGKEMPIVFEPNHPMEENVVK